MEQLEKRQVYSEKRLDRMYSLLRDDRLIDHVEQSSCAKEAPFKLSVTDLLFARVLTKSGAAASHFQLVISSRLLAKQ